MQDPSGATFSLMWLPNGGDAGVPASVGAIISLNSATAAAIGLTPQWLIPGSMIASSDLIPGPGAPFTLCAVYEVGQTPSPEMTAPDPSLADLIVPPPATPPSILYYPRVIQDFAPTPRDEAGGGEHYSPG